MGAAAGRNRGRDYSPGSTSDSEGSSTGSSSSSRSRGSSRSSRRENARPSCGKDRLRDRRRSSDSLPSGAAGSSDSSAVMSGHSKIPPSGTLLSNCCGSSLSTGPKEYLASRLALPEPAPKQALPRRGSRRLEKELPSFVQTSKQSRKGEAAMSRERQSSRPDRSHQKSTTNEKDDDSSDGAKSARSVQSARSDFSVRTAVVAQCSGSDKDAASLKAMLKGFVKSLTQGRTLSLRTPGGTDPRPAVLSLSPDKGALVVAVAGSVAAPEQVLLVDVLQVLHGMEATPLDLEVPLDAGSVVLDLAGGKNCLCLDLGSRADAEEFVLSLRLLTAVRRQELRKAKVVSQGPGSLGMTDKGDDNDDAQSTCSVQTVTVKQQMLASRVASVSQDPKEVKKMFKMFTETMRRGRDFYVFRANGELADIECALTSGHNAFRMRWDSNNREIPIPDLRAIHSAKEAASLNLGCPLDERCGTMELQSGECITFKFGHEEACERFVLCMRILLQQKKPRGAAQSANAPAQAQRGRGQKSASAAPPSAQKVSGQLRQPVVNIAPPQAPGAGDPRAQVEAFVQQMVAGTRLCVVGVGGVDAEVNCSLSPDVAALRVLAHDGSCREVALEDVKALHVGAEASVLGLPEASCGPRCGTVELESGACVSFRFPTAGERDRFVFCLRIFSEARRQAGSTASAARAR